MIIIGLGNPTKQYENTYHNIGFMVIDAVARMLSLSVVQKECSSVTGKMYRGDEKIVLAKPTTYMNLSGEAVIQLMGKYKTEAKDIIVIYDDLDIPLGSLRIRRSGSAGTHNGMRDIIFRIGTQDFPRVRVGIGKELSMPLVNFVTSRITSTDMEKLKDTVQKTAEAIVEYIDNRNIEALSQKYNITV